MIYKDFLIIKNQFGYYEAHHEDVEEFMYAKTIKQLKIEIDEYYNEH